MRLHHAATIAVAIAQASAATNSSSRLNGWYRCSDETFSDEGGSRDQNAECAVYSAPLCYPGICEAPATVDDTVDIFFKRLPALTGGSDSATNVWLLQGGPGASSTAMESAMVEVHTRMGGAVNVYTMDHRGTGRSALLDCVAAQATTTGSPSGSIIDVSEVPACANALEVKYGNLSSFSMTSAATDLSTFISNFSNGADTIVYGVSYGTALVERLIHLDTPEVVGYVLDGIATTSGAPADEFEYFSTWDADNGEIGDAFLARCANDSSCSDRFKTKSLSATLQDLITTFDNDPNSTCASLVGANNSVPASYILRNALGSLLQRASTRTLIPPVVYRLTRCASKDIPVLKYFFKALNAFNSEPNEDDAFNSNLLYYLIVFSEMWERPEVPMTDMLARFTNTRLTEGGTYSDVPLYCAFSKEDSTVCNQLNVGSYEGNGIVYEHDEYWNKSATIPSQASVLLLSGKLDPQTPNKYAEYLLKALDGDQKQLITFDHATHGALWTTPTVEGDDNSVTCGMELLLSYVSQSGVLKNLDTSCVGKMPAFSLAASLTYQYYFFSTNDLYDGEFDASLSGSSTGTSKSKSYKAVFIVFLVLFVLALVVGGYFAYRWHKLKHERKSAKDMPETGVTRAEDSSAMSPALTTSFSTQQVLEIRDVSSQS